MDTAVVLPFSPSANYKIVVEFVFQKNTFKLEQINDQLLAAMKNRFVYNINHDKTSIGGGINHLKSNISVENVYKHTNIVVRVEVKLNSVPPKTLDAFKAFIRLVANDIVLNAPDSWGVRYATLVG